jgi:hypothetical protein
MAIKLKTYVKLITINSRGQEKIEKKYFDSIDEARKFAEPYPMYCWKPKKGITYHDLGGD